MWVRRGEIWFADMSLAVGSEQAGERPVLVLSNEQCNKFAPVVIVCSITSQVKKMLPTHVELNLKEQSIAMLEQLRTIDKARLLHKLCDIDIETQMKVEMALMISVGLYDYMPVKKTFENRNEILCSV